MPKHNAGVGQSGAMIVFDGDSRTAGANGYGPYSAPCLVTIGIGRQLVGRNVGVSGRTVATMITAAAQVDVLRTRAKNVCVLWGGYNDWTGGASAATIESRLWTYCDARRAAGWKMVVCSELPAADATWQTPRDTLNTNIVANYASHADALVRLDADATMGPWASRDSTTYYSDQTHPTDAGYAIIAGLVATAVAGVL